MGVPSYQPENGRNDYQNEVEGSVPGTVHLVDLDGTMRAQHARGSKNHDIVLVPAPSTDPNDPLNWSPRRKALSTICMCVYTLMVGIASAAIYSVLEPISDATNLTLGDLNAGTGYMFLAFGWGCLFWQPLAIQYGKRPVYLISILATLGTQVWAPYARNNGQWIASKILQGFFGAPIESLCEISVTDIYFQHERGFYIALYALLLAGSNFFAPVIAGFIADGQGWQWVLYWCAIFCGIGFVFLFFFMEETNYSRAVIMGKPIENDDQRRITTPPSPDPESELSSTEITEKTPHQPPNILETQPPTTTTSSSPSPQNQRTTPYLTKLLPLRPSLFPRKNHLKSMILRPLAFLSFPVIFYSGFAYGSALVWFNVLNATTSLILSKPPYSFPSSLVGLSYLSPLIGVALASFYTGFVGDRVVLWFARRNKGILEPEHRLWLFGPSVVMTPFGLVLWGVGASEGVNWFGCVFAMGVIAWTNAVGLQLSLAYCIDSYRDLAAEAVVTVIIIRNTMSFAVNYGITPWVEGMGLRNAFVLAAMVGMAQVATFLVMVKYGKRLRRRSAGRYGRFVREMAEDGMVH